MFPSHDPRAPDEAIDMTYRVARDCNVDLPTAQMISFHSEKTLRQICEEGAKTRDIDLNDSFYKARLDREMKLIADKDFEDYFYVIADMINYAKEHMLVGPARGSSAGSLVCYLTGITDIDPLKHDLLFERFIDKNRS